MSLNSLKTILNTIERVCEGEANSEISKFYEVTKYDGTRFVSPNYKDVGAVWLKLIKDIANQISVELDRVVNQSGIYFSSDSMKEIELQVNDIFSESKYISRLTRFSDGVQRKASRYGVNLDLSINGFDLANTAYQVGVKNTIRGAQSEINAQLDIYRHQSAPESIKNINRWRSYLEFKPLYAIGMLAFLMLIILLAGIGFKDIVGGLFSIWKP